MYSSRIKKSETAVNRDNFKARADVTIVHDECFSRVYLKLLKGSSECKQSNENVHSINNIWLGVNIELFTLGTTNGQTISYSSLVHSDHNNSFPYYGLWWDFLGNHSMIIVENTLGNIFVNFRSMLIKAEIVREKIIGRFANWPRSKCHVDIGGINRFWLN